VCLKPPDVEVLDNLSITDHLTFPPTTIAGNFQRLLHLLLFAELQLSFLCADLHFLLCEVKPGDFSSGHHQVLLLPQAVSADMVEKCDAEKKKESKSCFRRHFSQNLPLRVSDKEVEVVDDYGATAEEIGFGDEALLISSSGVEGGFGVDEVDVDGAVGGVGGVGGGAGADADAGDGAAEFSTRPPLCHLIGLLHISTYQTDYEVTNFCFCTFE